MIEWCTNLAASESGLWTTIFVTLVPLAYISIRYAEICLRRKLQWHVSSSSKLNLNLNRDVSRRPADTVPHRRHNAPTYESISDVQRNAVLSSSRLIYHDLHNVEQFPDVVDKALTFLQEIFQLTTSHAHACATGDGNNILDLQSYDSHLLRAFIKRWDDRVQTEWQEYLKARKTQSNPPYLFGNVAQAAAWVKRISPSKLVDGAWLSGISIATTNAADRQVQRSLWQTLSEEYGDGDLERNHVHVFQKLLRSLDPDFPDPSCVRYTDPGWGTDSAESWTSALVQLAMSHAAGAAGDALKFAPELLGFNLHFELVGLDTLQAMYELRELGLDPAYFALHVSIDNSDSGHTAMALESVIRHMDRVASQASCAREVAQSWARVQAGFCLSQYVSSLPVTLLAPVHARLSTPRPPTSDSDPVDLESEVTAMVRRKSLVSAGLHCSSRIRMKGRTVSEWMDSKLLSQPVEVRNFVDALAATRPWVCKGDSEKSLLVKEIRWGGRMFGSFTDREISTLTRWIDSLGSRPESRASHVDRGDDLWPSLKIGKRSWPDISTVGMPVVHSTLQTSMPPLQWPVGREKVEISHPEDLIALWILAPCVLERFLRIPSKAATQFGSFVVRIVRAQYGFATGPQGSVSGVDDMRDDRSSTYNLEDIAWEVASNLTPSFAPEGGSECFTDRRAWLSRHGLADLIGTYTQAPWSNTSFLLGVAQGMTELHKLFVTGAAGLLPSFEYRHSLARIVSVEEVYIAKCIDLIRHDRMNEEDSVMREIDCGRQLVRCEVARLFS